MLAILGGAAAGTLWFLYSCVRGLPHFLPLQSGYEGSGDFLPPLLMGIGAFLLWTFRRRVAAVFRPVIAPLARIPLVGRFAMGGGVLLVGWLFRYKSGLFQGREGVDLITPLLMVALPVLIVVFREPLDALLRPLAPIRSKIPRIVLVVVGLAVPFLVAHVVYHWFHITQYPFLRISVVLGTMLSYAIIRTPAKSGAAGGAPASAGRSGPPPLPDRAGSRSASERRAAWVGLAWILGAHLLMVTPALADDFFRDPFNGNDGLRTPGVATAIAGTVTVVVSGLVNGAEVVRTIIEAQGGAKGGGSGAGGGAAGAGGGEAEKELQVDIVVTTTDARGQPGTRLEPGVNDAVFIYARCEKKGSEAVSMPCEIQGFHLGSGAPFVFLHDHGIVGGQRCAGVQVEDPLPESAPPTSVVVTVSASIGGKSVSVPVSLEFVAPQYFIRFS